MLTATFSVATIMVEWRIAHSRFSAIEQDIAKRRADSARIDPLLLAPMVDELSQFDQRCHSKKLEQYVIPFIRKSTTEADSLLAELDALKTRGMALILSVHAALHAIVEQGVAKAEELCQIMQLYCKTLYQRLRREEQLVQIAQRVIPVEGWFDIATRFFSDQGRHACCKQYSQQAPPQFINGESVLA